MTQALKYRSDKGASAVEFALVAGILVVLLVGIIQFGFLFFQWLEVTHAAREGARWAALGNPDGEVIVRAQNAAPGLDWGDNGTVLVTYPEGSSDPGNPVRVAVTYDTPVFAPLMQVILGVDGATFTLRSAAVQRIE